MMHAIALLPRRLKPKRQGSRHQIAPETSKRGLPSARYGSTSSSISLRMLTCTGRKNNDADEKKMEVSDVDALSESFDGVADILQGSPVSISRTVYQRACARLELVPSRHVYCRLEQTEIHLPNCFLGAREVKAIAIALVHNNTVHTLDLHGNDLGPQGLTFIVEMLQENRTITDLNLSNTALRKGGAEIIANGLLKNTSIVKLNISDNDFQENDALYISELMQKSKTLRELNVSHNCFREEAGVLIGRALAVNSSLRTLDLSWNHLRLIGAEAICRGLKVNRGLIRLFLSWNGFGMEGCYEMGKALKENRTLIELDLSANRVNITAFKVLLRGLLHNNTLRVLKIGVNPITTDGATCILNAMDADDATALIELDLSDVSVDDNFLEVLKRVQLNRPLQVKYGVALRQSDIKRGGGDSVVLDTDDPASLLFEYMRKKNLRLIDLLSSLDKDNSWSLDREELRAGLLNEDIPLSSRSMDIMMTKLDTNKDGFVDYEELASALKEYTRRLSKRQKKAGKRSEPVIDQLENLRQRIRLRIENSGSHKENNGSPKSVAERHWQI